MKTRRQALGLLAAAASSAALPAQASRPAKIAMEVWKDPNCGCCKDWVEIMQKSGFAVTVHDSGNAAVRAQLGLPQRLGSCHTALVDGYLIEGHVPAADIHRLLKEKPKALGLTNPGMPVGSPGMDGPQYQGRKDPYDILLVSQTGEVSVFTRYR